MLSALPDYSLVQPSAGPPEDSSASEEAQAGILDERTQASQEFGAGRLPTEMLKLFGTYILLEMGMRCCSSTTRRHDSYSAEFGGGTGEARTGPGGRHPLAPTTSLSGHLDAVEQLGFSVEDFQILAPFWCGRPHG